MRWSCSLSPEQLPLRSTRLHCRLNHLGLPVQTGAVGLLLLNSLIIQSDASCSSFFFWDSKICMENHTNRHDVAILLVFAAPTSPLLASKQCLEKKGWLWGRFIKSGSLSPRLSFQFCHPWPWMRGWWAGLRVAIWLTGIKSPACQAW